MNLQRALLKGMLFVFAAGIYLGAPHSVRAEDTKLSKAAVRDSASGAVRDGREAENAGEEYEEKIPGYSLEGGKIFLKDVQASGTCGDALKWEYDSEASSLTISGTGSMYSYPGGAPWLPYASNIRTLTIQEGITSIGEAAFYQLLNIKEVTLPASLRTMETAAFADCYGLTSIKLNQGLKNIPIYAFQGTAITSIELPASLEMYDANAFLYGNLQSISVSPGSISFSTEDGILFSADKTCLYHCPPLKSGIYQIPSSVKTIGAYAFRSSDYGKISIPGSVTVIEDGAFYESRIEDITIPGSVDKIGDMAFMYCDKARTLTLGRGNVALGVKVFALCEALTEVTLPQGMESVPNTAFYHCTTLNTVHFPSGLKKIEYGAFLDCSALKGVTFPKGLTSIAEDAFWGTAVIRAEIPDSVTFIGADAFPPDTSLVLPSKLAKMEDGSYGVVQVASVQSKLLYSSAFEVLTLVNKERAAQGVSALVMDKELLDAAMLRAQELGIYFDHTRPTGASCFSIASKMYGENIAAGQTSASSVMNSWMNSPGHKANILAENYTGIGVGAVLIDGTYYWVQCFGQGDMNKVSASSYKDKTNVEKIKLSLDNKDIKYGVDISATSIQAKKTADIGLYFYNGFMTITILPDYLSYKSSDTSICKVSQGKITGIGAGTAQVTVSLKESPEISGTKSIKVKGDAGAAFQQPAVGTKLTDKKSKGAYKVTKSASTVAYTGTTDKKAAFVTIPSTVKSGGVTYKVTSIANNAFKNNKKLKKITISGNVVSIGSGAFLNCTALTKVTIPSKVSKIGSKAFYNCKRLTSITIKSQKLTVKNVASKAFTKAGSSNYKKVKVTVPSKKYTEYKALLKKKGLSSKIKVKKK